MIALHAAFASKNPKEFLADKGYVFPFAHDADGSVLELTGGTGTMPQTVVLNRKGEVIYNKSGSVTPELLEALYKEADESAPKVAEAPAEAVSAETTQAPEEAAAPAAASYTSDAPVGHEVGQQLPDFTVTCLDGSTFAAAGLHGDLPGRQHVPPGGPAGEDHVHQLLGDLLHALRTGAAPLQ